MTAGRYWRGSQAQPALEGASWPSPVAPAPRPVAHLAPAPRARWDALMVSLAVLVLVTTWRIQDLFPILITLQTPTLAALATYALYVMNARGIRALGRIGHPITTLLLVIFFLMMVSVPWGVWPGHSFNFIFKDHIKTLAMMLIIAAAIRSAVDVERFVQIQVVGAVVYSLIVITTIQVGQSGRLGDLWYYDANDLGMLLAASLPLMVYLARPGAKPLSRLAGIAGLGVAAMTIIKTGSRGGFLAVLAAGAFLLFGFTAIPKRTRITAVAAILLLLVALGSNRYWEMMGTILHPTQDYNWSGKSDVGRMEIWKRGIGYMMERPLWGVGANAFPEAEGMLSPLAARQDVGIGLKWSAAHNSFVQIGAELGIGGLLCFLLVLFQAFRSLRRVRQAARGDPDKARDASLADAMTGSLIAYCVGGFLLSQAYSPLLYALLGMVVGLVKVNPASRATRRASVARRRG